jgi:hypothetical protein
MRIGRGNVVSTFVLPPLQLQGAWVCVGGSQGFKPISAKIIVRRYNGPMTFVTEGQVDCSQARSAWDSAIPQQSRPVGYGLIRAGKR